MTQDFFSPHIPDRMYFKIGEVCKISGVKPYVLRYWESVFDVISPQKSKANQRVYEKKDIESILLIKKLLWAERFSIEGAKQKLKEMKQQQRSKRISEERSPSTLKLNQVKEELKELIRFLRAN